MRYWMYQIIWNNGNPTETHYLKGFDNEQAIRDYFGPADPRFDLVITEQIY